VPEYRRELARSHGNLGNLLKTQGKRPEAEAHYRQAVALGERLVADFPRVPAYAVSLGGSYCNFGLVLTEGGQPAQALEWYAQAIRVLQQALDRTPDVRAREFLRKSHANRAVALGRIGRHAEAVPDWDRAIALDEGPQRPTDRLLRACALAHCGEGTQATREATEVLQASIPGADLLYEAACVYALVAAHAEKAPRPPQTSSLRAEQHARRAMALLRDAVAKGYRDVAHLRRDPDLDRLQVRADFQQLVADLEARQKPAPPPAKE
jgi:tetratricopeptide (TPR) repeat protein